MKKIINIIFILANAVMLAYVLPELTNNVVLKGVYFLLAVGIDLFRQYVAMEAKASVLIKKIFLWLLYFIISSIIVVIVSAFAMSQVSTLADKQYLQNVQNKMLIKDVEFLEKQLEMEMAKTNARLWYIRQLQNERQKKMASINYADTEHTASGAFGALATVLGVDVNKVKFFVVLAIAFLMEVVLFVTSWEKRKGFEKRKVILKHKLRRGKKIPISKLKEEI